MPKSVGTNGHDDPASWELELNPAGCDRLIEEPDIFSLRPGSFGGTLSWYASPRPDRLHTDGLLAKDAEWVLERCAQERERPFFLAVGFYRPHTPYVAPETYFRDYPRTRISLIEGVEEDQMDMPAMALGSHKKEHKLLTDDLRRQAKQAYYASITFMDAQVGHVLDALDRLGLAENTIVVFTSDHGYHLGEHGLWQKMSLFEESARVPLVIAAPGMAQPGSVAEAPVGLIDLYPTLTELCAVTAPDNLQGQSLATMLQSPTTMGRGWALCQVARGPRDDRKFGYALRTSRWRYTEWDQGRAGRELYDHDHDVLEQTNLADAPAHAGQIANLSEILHHAVTQSFPATRKRPKIRTGTWAPNITNP